MSSVVGGYSVDWNIVDSTHDDCEDRRFVGNVGYIFGCVEPSLLNASQREIISPRGRDCGGVEVEYNTIARYHDGVGVYVDRPAFWEEYSRHRDGNLWASGIVNNDAGLEDKASQSSSVKEY